MATVPAPDWVQDLAAMETKGPLAPPLPCPDLPEWMNDLRLWYGLEAFTFAAAPSLTQQPAEFVEPLLPVPCDMVPHWLAELLPETKPLSSLGSPPAAPPITQTTLPSPLPAAPLAPRPPAPPLASPGAPSTVTGTPTGEPLISETVVPAPGPKTVAHAAPAPTKLKPVPVDVFAQKAIDETGFDPRSGEIVDTAQFQKWKQEKASPGAAADSPTNASLMAAFRKGRTAIENWVDHEENKTLVLVGDATAIQANSQLAAILAEFEKFGPVIRQKLQAHLAFMIDNRRKYHAAYNAMFGSTDRTP